MNYNLLFAGNPLNPLLRDYLMEINVKDEIGLLSDTVDVLFTYDPKFPDFEVGMLMSVKLGDSDRLWDVGQYYVSELSMQGPPHELVVRGLSSPLIISKALQDSHRRNWQRGDAKLSEIMTQVVRDAGLKLKYNAPDPVMPYTAQMGESDASFLMRLARLRDLNFKVDGENLLVYEIGAAVDTVGRPLKTVVVNYVPSDKPPYTMQYTFVREELDAYSSASAWVQEVQANEKVKVEVGSGSPKYEFRETFPTIEEAKQACQAKLNESNRKTERASVVVPGQPNIIAGGKMELKGFPKMVNNTYLIETVSHNFSNTAGYTISANLVKDLG